MDKELAIKDLLEVKQVFDYYKVPFLLAYGTLLGAYRDKDFLPEDNDIDLVVIEPISYKMRKDIGWSLYNLGFNVPDMAFNVFNRMEPVEIGYNGDEKTGIICCEKNVEFSIFFFYKEMCNRHGEEYVCIPKMGALKLISSPTKFYKKLDTIKFYKHKFLTPSPIKDYLEFTYKDWKNPLARDHGLTYFEMHQEKTEVLKNVMDENQVYRAVERGI